MMGSVKILFVSNLFPDQEHPAFGIHNANLVRRLAVGDKVRVLAPRPRLGAWLGAGRQAAQPCGEDADLAPVFPRVPYVPKVGSLVNHRLYARWLRPVFARAQAAFSPDVVLAAWAYPDACACIRLCRSLGLPCVVVAQGSDVHDYLFRPVRRRIILRHLAQAAMIITRSENLRQSLLAAGMSTGSVQTIYNGVDESLFHPAADRAEVRRERDISPETTAVLFVGNLVPVKDPLLAYAAFRALRQAHPGQDHVFLVIGDGPLRGALAAAAAADGLQGRVRLLGRCLQAEVARYMQAADALLVSSRNEGAPNVIREALACALPVAATRVGGIPEVLRDMPSCGLASHGDATGLMQALGTVLHPDARQELAGMGSRFSWSDTVTHYRRMLLRITAAAPSRQELSRHADGDA